MFARIDSEPFSKGESAIEDRGAGKVLWSPEKWRTLRRARHWIFDSEAGLTTSLEPSYYLYCQFCCSNSAETDLGGVVACEVEGGFALSPSANSLAFEKKSLLESR
jgi:hypothetical protein